MRLSYSPAAQFFLFLVQWTDCHLAGSLGLLRVLIYMVPLSLLLVYYIHHALLLDCLINSLSYVWFRLMRMGKPQCRFTKEKPVSESSTVYVLFCVYVIFDIAYAYTLLFFFLICSCYIPILVATTKGNHRPRRP